MTKYVKLIDETRLECAPKNKGDIINYNLDTARILNDGYKPFIKATVEKPHLAHTITYVELDDVIMEVVTYVETEDEFQQKLIKAEQEHIATLFLTGADVERGIYKATGMDFEDIITMVAQLQPEGIDIKALKIELKANHFYRGNPYVDAVGRLLGFTSEQLNNFFEDGNYEHLLSVAE